MQLGSVFRSVTGQAKLSSAARSFQFWVAVSIQQKLRCRGFLFFFCSQGMGVVAGQVCFLWILSYWIWSFGQSAVVHITWLFLAGKVNKQGSKNARLCSPVCMCMRSGR
ncbi:hypothetical protein BS78_04G128900 [Paspalum vaginatum]|nr:hypothetical protein BS78_04G128900 [Paspalum vaginatum]